MPGGRPSKLTPARVERLHDALRLGLSQQLASHHAGISPRTYRNWMKRGEEAQRGEYATFFADSQRAVAQGVLALVEAINDAAVAGDWRAAAWLLERRFPQDYARSRVEHGDPDDGPRDIKITEIIVQGPAKGPVLLDDDNPRRDD